MKVSFRNILLTLNLLGLSGCSGEVILVTPSSQVASTSLHQIQIVTDVPSNQSSYTNFGPTLKVRFIDENGSPLTPPSDVNLELLGSGNLTTGNLIQNSDGTYSPENLSVDTAGAGNRIRISKGTISTETQTFNVSTRSLPFTFPTHTNNIDPDSTIFENTYTVTNITELRALIYKRVDTNNDGSIGAGDAFRWVALQPSTKIILADGDWTDIGRIYIGGIGENGRPIVIESQTRGGAIFKGTTEIYMYGSYVSMKGLSYQGIKPTVTSSGGVNTMAGSTLALGRTNTSNSISLNGFNMGGPVPLSCNFCAFRYNKIDNSALVYDPAQTNPSEEYGDLWMHGTNSEVSNNTFMGKNHPGHLIVVWRTDGVSDQHKIFKNEFMDQILSLGGTNGNEVIRVGTGAETNSSSNTLIEQNLFENVDGEIETISLKSWDNTVRFNTFRNNKGSVCIRSGGRNLIEGNYFLGMNKVGSGGIRAIHENNLIVGNHIQDTNPSNGGDITKNAGIIIPMGTDNPSSNYYYPVVNTKVGFNMFSNNRLTLGLGLDAASSVANDTIDPLNVRIVNNVIKGRTNEPYMDRYSPESSFIFTRNYAEGGLMDSSRTTLTDTSDSVLLPFTIMTQTWHLADKPEDPMHEVVRVTPANLTAAGFTSSEVSRLTMTGATIYEVHSPLVRGDVGCGY